MATVIEHLEQDSYLADLMEGVAPEWRSEFQRFVETGEAQDTFLSYLNQDAAAQEAVEKAFDHQVEQFEGLAAELKKRQESKSSVVASSAAMSTKLAAVVEVVMQTPREQRESVVETSTAQLVASTPVEERKVLEQVARSIDNNLSKLGDATHT